MRHVRTKLVHSGGVPKDAFRWIDPWNMFLEMAAGTGKGWCTQNAQIFTFLANLCRHSDALRLRRQHRG